MNRVKEALLSESQKVQNLVSAISKDKVGTAIKSIQEKLAEESITLFPHLDTQLIADSLATDPLPAFKKIVENMSVLEIQELMAYKEPQNLGHKIGNTVLNVVDFASFGVIHKTLFALASWLYGVKFEKLSGDNFESLQKALNYLCLLDLLGQK